MIQANVTTTTGHEDVLREPFEPHPGEYHLVKIDQNGNELPGSDVSIAPITFNRTYSKLPNYKVKKSPESNR